MGAGYEAVFVALSPAGPGSVNAQVIGDCHDAGTANPNDPMPLSPFVRSWIANLLLLAAVFAAVVGSIPARAADGFLDPEQAFVLHIAPAASPGTVTLRWTIAPGYYLYRDRLEVTAVPAGSAQVAFERPRGERKEDPNFGAVEVYHDQVALTVQAGGAQALQVGWQGCAEEGLCYLPQTREVALGAMVGGTAGGTTGGAEGGMAAAGSAGRDGGADVAAGQASAWAQATAGSDSAVRTLLLDRSLAFTLALFFALGLALAFTPCVLPMVPILYSIVVGSQATPRRALALSLAFVLPMALTYAGVGVGAALAGANLQALLQNPWVLAAMGLVFVLLAGSMFGWYELRLPSALSARLDGASRSQRGGTLAGAGAMGVLSALLVGPCMTAPLAGTLLYIAQGGQPLQGGLLLFALGLGMGVPLLLVGTLGARVLPRPGPWMEGVKAGFGFGLLATAIWMVQRVLPAPAALALWGALFVALAVALAQLGRGSTSAARRVLAPAAALLVGLWGGAMWLGAAAGAGDPVRPLGFIAQAGSAAPAAATHASRTVAVDSTEGLAAALAQAGAAGRPVLLDFTADWCVSCKTIEREVFGDPAVQQALAGVVLLRADVTAGTPAQRALMRAHGVVGPPTVMLFDAAGQELRPSRLVGEFEAASLLQRLPAVPPAMGAAAGAPL